MMVTILLGEQGAMFTQRPSFDLFRPKEAWKFTQRPSFDLFRLDNAMDEYTQAQTERQREIHYYTTYGTEGCMTSKDILITRGKAVLCIIGLWSRKLLWSFHRKKIADHVGPICGIVIMARLRTLIRDDMITVR